MQALEQQVHRLSWAADFNLDALRIVAHPAGELEFVGDSPDEGAKADALDDAAQADALTDDFRVLCELLAHGSP